MMSISNLLPIAGRGSAQPPGHLEIYRTPVTIRRPPRSRSANVERGSSPCAGAEYQIPVHNDTKGIGAQMPTEKYGVRSPFQPGGGGGGGGGGGAAMQVSVGGS